jgi:hypothetical protein
MPNTRIVPLLPWTTTLRHMAATAAIGFGLIAVSLFVGMSGYHVFEQMPWVDAFVNASMILSGMGPVGELKTTGGKIFAGCYALYSGLALITIAAITLSPLIRRFLHKFHLDTHRDQD